MKLKYRAKIVKGSTVPLPYEIGKIAVGLSKFRQDKEVLVTIETPPMIRTLSQNSRMWCLMQAFVELGWNKDEAKDWACAKFLDPVVHEFPDGTRTESTRRTSMLTTKEMGEFQDRIERFLNEKGLWFPEEHHGR